ncbi:hypothetical protein Bca52824_029251 [Brassica carinata]|uniref:Uncharacterized protein n=1 Tax=Brassica carinata TaxID=52824 RepID=A0A8X8ARE8_BRACI|nr:hypothetical protein Bca52824_029251 [Brassica carinata]
MTTTRSDSDERLAQDPETSRNGYSQDSLKVVSLPPLEKDSVGEMMTSSKKQVKSSPLASVLEKDEETIHSDSDEASFSREPETMGVDSPGVVSVPETTSAFLEEDGIGEELQRVKETSAANISEAGDDVEADGSVVCVSEKKGQEDSDVQRLLEAEKRRLLAKDQHQKVERVRVEDNAFVGRSVNIDLVDDTALLNVVSFSKKGKDHHPKDAPRKHKKHIGGGGKQQDKGNDSDVVEGKEMRIVYSINQMKSMRYAHPANQKKLWSDVYARLLPELVSEYEGLVCWKIQKSGIGILGTKEGLDDLTLEEEEDKYSEDNDDYNCILRPAFAVDGEPDFESGPPEDGFEYLRRVRWEAQRVPNVKVAKIDGSKFLVSVSTVPDESFGGLVSDIQGMDSVTRVSRLKKRICLVEKESGLESSDCKWVVALCASVDTPLDGDTCACLRALLRKCASLRAFEVEDEQVIIMANMLITIASRYFGLWPNGVRVEVS